MFMKYGPKVQTSFTTQSCTHQGLISKKNKSSAVVIPKALELQINALYCGKISLGLVAIVVEIRSPPGSSPIMPFYCPDNHVITQRNSLGSPNICAAADHHHHHGRIKGHCDGITRRKSLLNCDQRRSSKRAIQLYYPKEFSRDPSGAIAFSMSPKRMVIQNCCCSY